MPAVLLSPIGMITQMLTDQGIVGIGFKINTYVGGTVSTPQTTYTDSTGTVQNTNPIVMGSNGRFQSVSVWAVPGTLIKMVITDSLNNLIAGGTIDNIPLFNDPTSFTQASLGAILYPQTAAELAASVTPTNYIYPPGNVLRYGAAGNGVINDAPAFQSAIKVANQISTGSIYAPAGSVGTVYVPPPPGPFYLLTSGLDCTSPATAPNERGIVIRADAGANTDAPTIILKHTGYGFDLTGNDGILFDNLNIGTDTTTYPKVCFFEARTTVTGTPNTYPSAGYHRYQNVRVHGKFSKCICYNYGSESNVYSGCVWANEAADVGTKTFVFTISNILALTSSFTTIATGNQSTIDHQIVGGDFLNTNPDAASDVFYLDAISHLKMFGPWILAQGRSGIYIDSTVAGSAYVRLYAFQIENGVNNPYAIRFGGETVSNSSNWIISGCNLSNVTFAISAHVNHTIDSFLIEGVSEAAGAHGISIAGTVQSSILLLGFTSLIAGTSKQNTIVGDASRWTITTRNADNWIDHGGVKNAWTPALGTVTHGGVITFNENRCLFEGNMVHFELLMTDTVSITATLAQTITGLPVAALRRSADIIFVNANTAAALGTGFIQAGATTIQCPAFSVGAGVSVCVSGSYFVA